MRRAALAALRARRSAHQPRARSPPPRAPCVTPIARAPRRGFAMRRRRMTAALRRRRSPAAGPGPTPHPSGRNPWRAGNTRHRLPCSPRRPSGKATVPPRAPHPTSRTRASEATPMTFKRASLRYGDTPAPVTPYQKAAQVWDDRIGSARVQAHNWRLMALGSLGLALILAVILSWFARSGAATPYIVEVDVAGGVRAVGPAGETYKPSDAQIAFHLARFVDHVRSLSLDPVVVRQNWLKAYDYVSDRAAISLNDYAREHDPFQRIGRETVAVEVASVVRASESSFQVRWLERQFDGGALKETRRLTGLFSILMAPPRTMEQVRKNPLGIYVHAFNWSQDVATAGEPK